MDLRRRELLTMGGAGVAGLTVPWFSFFPDPVAFAQGNRGSDPLLAEITRQLRRVVAGLAATPPKGNAQQMAALFRMSSAWARVNNVDATFRQKLDEALATEGHQAFVTRIAAIDRVAAARAAGLPPAPFIQNNTDPDAVAKAIGAYKGGMTIERALRHIAWTMDHYARPFDNRMAVLNNRQPEAIFRRVRVQDVTDWATCVENNGDPGWCDQAYPPPDDCLRNSDGSFSCALTYTAPPPPPASGGCSDVMGILFWTAGAELDMFLALLGSLGLWAVLVNAAFAGFVLAVC